MNDSKAIGYSAVRVGLVLGAGALLVGGCQNTTRAALPEQGLRTIASGSFEGNAGHQVTGQARLAESYGKIYLEFDEGFSFEEGERARVGFGRDGEFVASSRFTSLKAANGKQVYYVPESINPYDFNEVYVWGSKSREVLGFAELERAPETLTGMFAPEKTKDTTTATTNSTDTQASVRTED